MSPSFKVPPVGNPDDYTEQDVRAALMMADVYRSRARVLRGVQRRLERLGPVTHGEAIEVLDKTIELYYDLAVEIRNALADDVQLPSSSQPPPSGRKGRHGR